MMAIQEEKKTEFSSFAIVIDGCSPHSSDPANELKHYELFPTSGGDYALNCSPLIPSREELLSTVYQPDCSASLCPSCL